MARTGQLPAKIGNWKITLKPSGRSGYLDGPNWSDSFICYDNGNAAYDAPERIPKAVKHRVGWYCFIQSKKTGGR